MEEKIKISLPIIVEGRYDKAALSGFIEGTVITTGGFSIFNNKEKQALISRIAERGIIVLVDSDAGGRQIRSFLSGILPKEKIYNAYIPRIAGKEGRKSRPSREGVLGVEGMSREVLLRALAPFVSAEEGARRFEISKTDFYLHGLSGSENSSERRRELCRLCDLPEDMTANALLEAMNLLYSKEEYLGLVDRIAGKC